MNREEMRPSGVATKILLSEEVRAQIGAHGAEAYPQECCGALLGHESETGREITALLALVNRSEDSPRNRFSVTAEDVRVAERAARDKGLEVVGWYHSHPDHPARPSEYDREYAWPWYSYIIVSVAEGTAQGMSSWQLAEDRSGFSEEKIEVMRVRAGEAQFERAER
jgi:proteasome lid subunit RPN8/RPN11